jgi:uncharacterized membrane protein YeiB
MIRRFITKIVGYAHEFGLYSSLAWFDHHWFQLMVIGFGVLAIVVIASMWWEDVR